MSDSSLGINVVDNAKAFLDKYSFSLPEDAVIPVYHTARIIISNLLLVIEDQEKQLMKK